VTVPVINSNSSLVCGRVVSRTSVARAENVLSLQITPNVVVGASDCAALDVEPLVVSTSVPPFYRVDEPEETRPIPPRFCLQSLLRLRWQRDR